MQVLPWESVPGPIYRAVDAMRKKGWVKAGGWILVVCLLIGGVVTRWKIALVFGLLYMLALVMKKDVAVTGRGLEIFYQMQITTQYDFWPWEEIFAVTYEPDPKDPSKTLLYFTRGDRTKKHVFTKSDAEEVLALAKRCNANVKLYDGTKARNKK